MAGLAEEAAAAAVEDGLAEVMIIIFIEKTYKVCSLVQLSLCMHKLDYLAIVTLN